MRSMAFCVTVSLMGVAIGVIRADGLSDARHKSLTNNQDWPQWRGPRGDSVSNETGWSVDWPDEGPPVLWSVNLGLADNKDGSSTVSVVNDRVYVMGIGEMHCLDAESGESIWSVPFTASHSTPAVDGNRIYIYGTEGTLMCLDASTGELAWTKDLHQGQNRFARKVGAYGYAASPVVMGDVVLVTARIEGGALVALDKQSGETRWQAHHLGHSGYALWSTPVVTEIEGAACIVWLPGPSIVGLNPGNGQTIWKYEIPEENGKVGCAGGVAGHHRQPRDRTISPAPCSGVHVLPGGGRRPSG